MPGNHTNGPLLEDYKRAIKAAKWGGAKVVRVEIGGAAIAILLDDAYLEKLAPGQPPAPILPGEEKPKHNW
jgi:hypothetical protein